MQTLNLTLTSIQHHTLSVILDEAIERHKEGIAKLRAEGFGPEGIPVVMHESCLAYLNDAKKGLKV